MNEKKRNGENNIKIFFYIIIGTLLLYPIVGILALFFEGWLTIFLPQTCLIVNSVFIILFLFTLRNRNLVPEKLLRLTIIAFIVFASIQFIHNFVLIPLGIPLFSISLAQRPEGSYLVYDHPQAGILFVILFIVEGLAFAGLYYSFSWIKNVKGKKIIFTHSLSKPISYLLFLILTYSIPISLVNTTAIVVRQYIHFILTVSHFALSFITIFLIGVFLLTHRKTFQKVFQDV